MLARIKLNPRRCAWNSHTKAKGALNNVTDSTIYLNTIVFCQSAHVIKSQKAVPGQSSRGSTWPTSRVRPGSAIIRKTKAGPERLGTTYLTPSRSKYRHRRTAAQMRMYEAVFAIEAVRSYIYVRG